MLYSATDNKIVATCLVTFTDAAPAATSVSFKGKANDANTYGQAIYSSKVYTNGDDKYEFSPSSNRIKTAKLVPSAITIGDDKIVITNANDLRDTYTIKIDDQYGSTMTGSKFFVDGQAPVNVTAGSWTASSEHVLQITNGTKSASYTVVVGNANTTVTVKADTAGKTYTAKTEDELLTQLKLGGKNGKKDTYHITTDMDLADVLADANTAGIDGDSDGDFTLEAGDTLVIDDGATVGVAGYTGTPTLYVSEGATFTINGIFIDDNAGTITVKVDGTINGSGHYTAAHLTDIGGTNADAIVSLTGTSLELLAAPTTHTGKGKIGGNVIIGTGVTVDLSAMKSVKGASFTLAGAGANVKLPASVKAGDENVTVTVGSKTWTVTEAVGDSVTLTYVSATSISLKSSASTGGSSIKDTATGVEQTTSSAAPVSSFDSSTVSLTATLNSSTVSGNGIALGGTGLTNQLENNEAYDVEGLTAALSAGFTVTIAASSAMSGWTPTYAWTGVSSTGAAATIKGTEEYTCMVT